LSLLLGGRKDEFAVHLQHGLGVQTHNSSANPVR